jgi:hypothetical protein
MSAAGSARHGWHLARRPTWRELRALWNPVSIVCTGAVCGTLRRHNTVACVPPREGWVSVRDDSGPYAAFGSEACTSYLGTAYDC